jgi:hypothetical protein
MDTQMEISKKNHRDKVKHIRHSIQYKKVVFRYIFPSLPFSEEVEKYLFTFIGVFPLTDVSLSYTVIAPEPLLSSASFPLHTSSLDLSPNTTNDLAIYES